MLNRGVVVEEELRKQLRPVAHGLAALTSHALEIEIGAAEIRNIT